MDLVERQKVIDAILIEYNTEDSDYPTDYQLGLAKAKQIVMELPSAEPEKVCIAKVTITDEQVREIVEKIKHDAPIIIPERKKGKWEAFMAYGKTVRHRCSECLAVAARDDFGKEYLSDYCTVCGADMRGVTS